MGPVVAAAVVVAVVGALVDALVVAFVDALVVALVGALVVSLVGALVVAAGGVLESNRAVGEGGEGAVGGGGDVEEGVGKVGGAVAELEGLAVAGLITALAWISGKSSGNCRLAPFLPSLMATGYSLFKAQGTSRNLHLETGLQAVDCFCLGRASG